MNKEQEEEKIRVANKKWLTSKKKKRSKNWRFALKLSIQTRKDHE
jgi:hypothetical protein